MTYKEILERAALMAHRDDPSKPLDRLRISAEAIFPSIVEELAIAVAMNPLHPWRVVLQDVTASIANGALIPQTSTNSKQIIGVHGIVKDASDSKALTENFAIDEIRALIENINTWRQTDVYAYRIIPPRIYHTRTNVVIDVCVYDVAAVRAAIVANTVPLFPDAEGAYVTALTAKLKDPGARFDVDYQGQIMVIKEKL